MSNSACWALVDIMCNSVGSYCLSHKNHVVIPSSTTQSNYIDPNSSPNEPAPTQNHLVRSTALSLSLFSLSLSLSLSCFLPFSLSLFLFFFPFLPSLPPCFLASLLPCFLAYFLPSFHFSLSLSASFFDFLFASFFGARPVRVKINGTNFVVLLETRPILWIHRHNQMTWPDGIRRLQEADRPTCWLQVASTWLGLWLQGEWCLGWPGWLVIGWDPTSQSGIVCIVLYSTWPQAQAS